MKTRLSDLIRALPFYALPHHLISWLLFHVARVRWRPLKNLLIDFYQVLHPVKLDEAEHPDAHAYASLNAFFTRALRAGARDLSGGDDTLACPVDGIVSQAGDINQGRIFQAKGRHYSLFELVGGRHELAEPFIDGRYATLYLSPTDYHRIHMPCAGTLTDMVYVPGRLFSVAPYTVRAVPRLFARNERVVCSFDTEMGPLALVLVGAINVSAIDTVWSGPVTPPSRRRIEHRRYGAGMRIHLDKGAEMGRFNLGSTVIVLTPGNCQWEPDVAPGTRMQMGQRLGRRCAPNGG